MAIFDGLRLLAYDGGEGADKSQQIHNAED
jgi:hypothetical protein